MGVDRVTGNSLPRAISGFLLLAAAASACVPANNFGGASSSTTLIRGTSSSLAADGAQGLCRTFDQSNPDRLTCKSCYQTLLSQKCGTIDPTTCSSYFTDPAACCPDTTARAGFPGLVNTCISQTNLYGTTCSTTCPTGQVLSATSCTCIPITSAPAPTMPAGGSTYVNVGETNWGPPVVTLQYAPDYFATSVIASQNSCSAKIDPIQLFITNRGGTIPQLNVSEVVSASCILSNGLAAGNARFGGPSVSGVRTPAAAGATSTGFIMNSEGILDQYGVYWENFDSGAPAGWKYYNGVTPVSVLLNEPFVNVPNTSNRFMAPIGPANAKSITAAELTLPRMPPGTYKVEFEAYLLNGFASSFDILKGASVIANCSGHSVFASGSNSHAGTNYASLNCNPTAGYTSTAVAVGQVPSGSSNYDGDAGGTDDSLFHITLSGISVTTALPDIVLRFRSLSDSLGLDNVVISLQENIVLKDDMEASTTTPNVYPSAFPTPLESFTAEWIANGIPTDNITGIGWIGGRFAATEDDSDAGTKSNFDGYKRGRCATLHLPYLAAGDYSANFDLYLFDTWDGMNTSSSTNFATSGIGDRDEFLVKIEGDPDLRFWHVFSNQENANAYQTYGDSSSCKRLDRLDANEPYCLNCERSGCSKINMTGPLSWVPAHNSAYRYENFAYSGDKDSYYSVNVPFTQPASGRLIMNFCGNFRESTAGNLNRENESFGLKDLKIIGRGTDNAGTQVYASAFDQGPSKFSISKLSGTTYSTFAAQAPQKSGDNPSYAFPVNYSPSFNYTGTSTEQIPQRMRTGRFAAATTQMMGPFNYAARSLYPGLNIEGLEEGDYLVDFDVWTFDSWDGVAGAHSFNGDLVKVAINGTLAYSGGFYQNATGLGGEMLAGMPEVFSSLLNVNWAMADWSGSMQDRKFHGRASLHQPAPTRMGDRPKPVYIEWMDAALQADMTDESWALDNVVIRKTSGAPTVSCGIRYRFTDSNNNAADYCLRFKQVTYCGSGTCGCTAQPMNDIRGAFTVLNASQNQCP